MDAGFVLTEPDLDPGALARDCRSVPTEANRVVHGRLRHTAVEAWHLFMADGDFHSAAWSARTVIHALRARSCACG